MSWPAEASAFRVGTENSGVPMKINRSGMLQPCVTFDRWRSRSFRRAQLRRLGKFLGDAIALQFREIIDEQFAVEMIDLVLDAGREQAGRFFFVHLAVEIGVAEPHGRGALDFF